MWSKSQAGSFLTLVPSSTRMPQRTHRGWPDTILYNIHKEIRYRPTWWHTKLLSLEIPYVPYALVHSSACSFRRNQHRWGLPPWSSKFQIRPHILLPIQYSPLSPNCPTWSHIKPFYQLIIFWNHSSLEPGYKKLLSTSIEVLSSNRFSTK
jgi:hypothetical protein